MGFLRDKLASFGGQADAGMVGVEPTRMAKGVGRLIGEDPSGVARIANRIGVGSNMIAAGGGAMPGYVAPEPVPMNNYLQQLDPRIMQMFMRNFQGGRF